MQQDNDKLPLQKDSDAQQTSIYQRFKMNSHKIMIDVPKEGAFSDTKQNTKLEAIKKRIEKGKLQLKPNSKTNESKQPANILSQRLEEIPERTNQSAYSSAIKAKNKDKDASNLSSNLKEIENRILLKIKNTNKTDRKHNHLNGQIVRTQNDHIRSSLNLKSPGSDKSESLFPIIANTSMTSAYSTPYVKSSDQENDLKIGTFESDQKLSKSVGRSQSIRNGEFSKATDQDNDYSHHRRETPYDNHSSAYNNSRVNSESNKVAYPEVYKSRSKANLNDSKLNVSSLFEDSKNIRNIKGISKRYETDTADTDTSFGYKFIVKPTSRNSNNEDLSIVGHNEYSEINQNGNMERIKNRKRNLVNKSLSKQNEITTLPKIASSLSTKSISILPSIGKKLKGSSTTIDRYAIRMKYFKKYEEKWSHFYKNTRLG